jgi:hypothetical protein
MPFVHADEGAAMHLHDIWLIAKDKRSINMRAQQSSSIETDVKHTRLLILTAVSMWLLIRTHVCAPACSLVEEAMHVCNECQIRDWDVHA